MWKKDNVAFINDQFQVSGFLGLSVSSKKNRKSFWNLLLALVYGRLTLFWTGLVKGCNKKAN